MAVFFYEVTRAQGVGDVVRTDSGGAVGSGEIAVHIDDALSKQDALLALQDLMQAIEQDLGWLGG